MQGREQVEYCDPVFDTPLHLTLEKKRANAVFLEIAGIHGDVEEAVSFAIQRNLDRGCLAVGLQGSDAAGDRPGPPGCHVGEKGFEAVIGESA